MSMPSRKRAAPGAAPVSTQNTVNYSVPPTAQNQSLVNDNFPTDWAQSTTFPDPLNSFQPIGGSPIGGYDASTLAYTGVDADAQFGDFADPQFSGQLVRRNVNNQLSRQPDLPWEIEEHHDGDGWEEDGEDEAALERRAQDAKREALAKKRQIPPFVQKISR
jgi:heat shock transcription factor